MNGRTWLSWRIYLGSAGTKAEQLITGALPHVAAFDGVTRWFFLHHIDDAGPHLRLRVQTSGDPGLLRRHTEAILYATLEDLPRLPPSPYRPTILPALVDDPREGASTGRAGSRVDADRYDPDVTAFGTGGVGVAEDLFFASSRIALDVLVAERDQRYSRKTVIPLLMDAVRMAFLPEQASSFWSAYATYWFDFDPKVRDEWLPHFIDKARALHSGGIPVLPTDDGLSGDALETVRRWRHATLDGAEGFRAARDDPPRSPRDLAFHVVHGMNNRLRLLPLEEAYYATLIAASMQEARA